MAFAYQLLGLERERERMSSSKDAIPQDQRVNISIEGVSMPVGLSVGSCGCSFEIRLGSRQVTGACHCLSARKLGLCWRHLSGHWLKAFLVVPQAPQEGSEVLSALFEILTTEVLGHNVVQEVGGGRTNFPSQGHIKNRCLQVLVFMTDVFTATVHVAQHVAQ